MVPLRRAIIRWMRPGVHVAFCAVALAFALAGCGGSASSSSPTDVPASATTVAADACAAMRWPDAACAREAGQLVADIEQHVVGVAPQTAHVDCSHPVEIVAYAQADWLGLAKTFADAPRGCTDIWIGIPTQEGADHAWLTTRRGVKERFARLGDNVHAMPTVDFDDWNAWGKTHPNVSWLRRGQLARADMERAGYDFAAGDRWALNEVPILAVSSVETRNAVRDLLIGLQGDQEMPSGIVYSVIQPQNQLDPVVAARELDSWADDADFWRAARRATLVWSDEAYADIRATCEVGTSYAQQAQALSRYAFFRKALVERFAAVALPDLHAVLDRSIPLANGAWSWTHAYGWTAVPASVMADFARVQLRAMAKPWEGHLLVGVAWAPKRPDGMSARAYGLGLARTAAALRDQAVWMASADAALTKPKPCAWPGAKLRAW